MNTTVSSRFVGPLRPSAAIRARRLYLVACASLVACVSAVATARASVWTDGLYLKAFGGLHGLADGDIKQGGSSGDGSYSGGQIFGAAVGKQLSKNWAVEAEFFYRSNDIDSVSGGPLGGSTEGDFASTNLMFNAVYTFTRSDGSWLWGKFTPHVGAGVGFLQEADIDATIGGVSQEYDDSWIFAAQVFAGVSYAINERWSVYLETRYHYAGEIELKSSSGNNTLKADYNGYSGLVGVRYNF